MILEINKDKQHLNLNGLIYEFTKKLGSTKLNCYIRREHWPSDLYAKIKFNPDDRCWLTKLYSINSNCDEFEYLGHGWSTQISINDAICDDWELWMATMG